MPVKAEKILQMFVQNSLPEPCTASD